MTEYGMEGPRLLWARFRLGLNRIFLLGAYAPVSSAPQSDLEQFWTKVQQILDSTRDNERVIMCGDFNGWVGTRRPGLESVLGTFGDKKTNDAGKFILDVCLEKNLFVSNTMFAHKDIHMYTREMNNERSMIDLMIVDNRLKRNVLDTRVYRGYDLGTDHYVVITRFSGLYSGWRHRSVPRRIQAVERVKEEKLKEESARLE